MERPHPRSRAAATPAVVVDQMDDATAPPMLWGRRRKSKSKRKPRLKPSEKRSIQPIDMPQYVYLFQSSFDPDIVIAGITYDLKQRRWERGYGQLIWARQLQSRSACANAEARFMRITDEHAVGPEYRGKTTWTEARRMTQMDAIAAWIRAIGRMPSIDVPLITQTDCAAVDLTP